MPGRRCGASWPPKAGLKGTDFQPDYSFLDPKLDFYYDWMLRTFHRRNFTNEGLCHVLRYLSFEARLRIGEIDETQARTTAVLMFITAQANQLACQVLGAALDHIEATPSDQLRLDDEFLQSLTAWEQMHEDRLMNDIDEYLRVTVHRRLRRGAGGFERSWTFAGTAREAAGIGAA